MSENHRMSARGARARDRERFERAFGDLDAPFAFVDLDAMRRNAERMLASAAPKPLRIATKSVRSRALLEHLLALDSRLRGLLCFTLPEALWLARCGFSDLLCAYPTTDRSALRELAHSDLPEPPIVMCDSPAQLDFIERVVGTPKRPIRLCIEVDVSLPLFGGRLRIGARRSPIRTPQQARELAEEIARRRGFELCALMAYEAQVAGIPDLPAGKRLAAPAIAWIKRRSRAYARELREACVAAVREVADVSIVNGGGTGSLRTTAAEAVVTEVAAGSGFYAPALFDGYRDLALEPAAFFALPVVRKPDRTTVTLLGGGYVASGPAGRDRLPVVHAPSGLRFDPLEGAGEVQTPLRGRAARQLAVGDRVYLRHAKAGELCERFDELYLLSGGRVVDKVPTYRGEGRCFL